MFNLFTVLSWVKPEDLSIQGVPIKTSLPILKEGRPTKRISQKAFTKYIIKDNQTTFLEKDSRIFSLSFKFYAIFKISFIDKNTLYSILVFSLSEERCRDPPNSERNIL